jgi:transcriptional regulator with XRE-family HTH domain
MTGERFATLRHATGWSRRYVADLLQCDEKLVRRWETGAAPVPAQVAEWLAAVARAIERLPAPDDWRQG